MGYRGWERDRRVPQGSGGLDEGMTSSVRGPISKCELECPRGLWPPHVPMQLRTPGDLHTPWWDGQGSDRGERGSVRKIKLTDKAGWLRGLSHCADFNAERAGTYLHALFTYKSQNY